MTTALLFTTGFLLAFWIVCRNPGYAERYACWPTWWEWSVQAVGVVLMSVAAVRMLVAVLESM